MQAPEQRPEQAEVLAGARVPDLRPGPGAAQGQGVARGQEQRLRLLQDVAEQAAPQAEVRSWAG